MVQITPTRGRPQHFEETRAQILRLAAAAFRREGFFGASMKDIAAAAGMKTGNLYYYFSNKEDLLYACQKDALDRLMKGAKDVAASGAAAGEKLGALVRAHVLCLLEETGGSAAHLEFRALEGPHREEIQKRRDEYERVVRGVVAAGVKGGAFRRVDPKLATLAILGALNSTVTWWRPDGPLAPAAIADAFADLLVEGLAP